MRPRTAPGKTPKLTKSRTVSGHSSEVTISDPLNLQARATVKPKAPKTSTVMKRDIIVGAGDTPSACECQTDNPAATDVNNARMMEKLTILGSRIKFMIHHALFRPE